MPLSQPKPHNQIVYSTEAASVKVLDKQDVLLLKKIYKLESSDAILWSGRTDGIFVTLHDIHVILKDVDVANNLIDSFAKILVNEHDAIHPHKSYVLVTSEMEVREDEGTSTGQTPGGISQQVYVSILSNELQWECKG